VQKHEINVAVRVEFGAPETANGHQRNRRKFRVHFSGQFFNNGLPELLQQSVQDGRAGSANPPPAAAGAV